MLGKYHSRLGNNSIRRIRIFETYGKPYHRWQDNMSHIFLKIRPEDMDNMSHISLSLWGQTQYSHCFVLQRKLSYSINVVYEIRRQIIFM